MKLRGYLAENEHLIVGVRAHPVALLPAAGYLLGAAMVASFASSLMPTARYLAYLALAFALWLLVLATVRVLRWARTSYLLTNLRLVIQTGFLQAGQQSIPLQTIEAVHFKTSRLSVGKQADLTVSSLHTSYRLARVPHAGIFSQRIYRAQQEVLQSPYAQ